MVDKMFKLMSKQRSNRETFEALMDFCVAAMNVGTNNVQLKKFVNLLGAMEGEVLLPVLNSLLTIISNESPCDVLAFIGKSHSGIKLEGSKKLSAKGICFTTSILLEHRVGKVKEEIVFKLAASKEKLVILSLLEGYLHYNVSEE